MPGSPAAGAALGVVRRPGLRRRDDPRPSSRARRPAASRRRQSNRGSTRTDPRPGFSPERRTVTRAPGQTWTGESGPPRGSSTLDRRVRCIQTSSSGDPCRGRTDRKGWTRNLDSACLRMIVSRSSPRTHPKVCSPGPSASRGVPRSGRGSATSPPPHCQAIVLPDSNPSAKIEHVVPSPPQIPHESTTEADGSTSSQSGAGGGPAVTS